MVDMKTYLLDSNVIIDLLNGKNQMDEVLRSLISENSRLLCCAVTIAEVYSGMRDHEKDRTDRFLESFEYIDITPDIAKKAGLLQREWRKRGKTLLLPDLLLAALAIVQDVVLITQNIKDFPMKDIKLYEF